MKKGRRVAGRRLTSLESSVFNFMVDLKYRRNGFEKDEDEFNYSLPVQEF